MQYLRGCSAQRFRRALSDAQIVYAKMVASAWRNDTSTNANRPEPGAQDKGSRDRYEGRYFDTPPECSSGRASAEGVKSRHYNGRQHDPQPDLLSTMTAFRQGVAIVHDIDPAAQRSNGFKWQRLGEDIGRIP